MIISTLNVNGIRAASTKGLKNWIEKDDPDIICFQELKALENQVPKEIQLLNYYQYYHSAEKKGYSGVGVLTKEEPIDIKYGIGIDWIDIEGRYLLVELDKLVVISLYAPSGTTGDIRQDIKYKFLDVFFNHVSDLKKTYNKPILICGDYNIAHTEIDIHDPKSNKKTSGFLPEEREWFTKLLESGWYDLFRLNHKDEVDLYSWWSYRANARANNKGWRIDYIVCSEKLDNYIKKSWINTEYKLSDHAPVCVDISL